MLAPLPRSADRERARRASPKTPLQSPPPRSSWKLPSSPAPTSLRFPPKSESLFSSSYLRCVGKPLSQLVRKGPISCAN